MIIVLFHVLYLFGKFVYESYKSNKKKTIGDDDAINTEKEFNISQGDYMLRDPEAPQDYAVKTIRFFPPAYVQRYNTVSDVLKSSKYQGKLRKIVDFGCAELDFLVYLKNTPGVEEIICVDIDKQLLESYQNKAAPLVCEYLCTRNAPLLIEVCEGSVTHNDKKLENTDAVICIELIEHLYPDTLTDLPYNIFGYITPKLVVITTPNADFNVLFPNFSGFRHYDHKFEWTRQQFQDWAENIILRYPNYEVTFEGICKGPKGTEHLGCCTQMAIFHRVYEKDTYSRGIEGLFNTIASHEYPFRVDNRSDEEKILDEATYYIRHLSFQNCGMDEEVPLTALLNRLKSFNVSLETLQTILEEANWTVESRDDGPVVLVPQYSYSDYDVEVENDVWNDSGTDYDEEPGPPVDSIYHRDSVESWDNPNWQQEPSIIIPQNESTFENNIQFLDEDNWGGEPGPPVNSKYVNHDSLELEDNQTWHEEPSTINPQNDSISRPGMNSKDSNHDWNIPNWHQESSIIIPQSNAILEDDTYLQDDENVLTLDDTFEGTSVIADRHDELCRKNIGIPSIPGVNDLSNSQSTSSMKNFEDVKDDSYLDTIDIQNDVMLGIAQKLNCTLDVPTYMSVSRASTSPEPYLIEAVRIEQNYQNDSMCNQSMSNNWMLNNTFEQDSASLNFRDMNDSDVQSLQQSNYSDSDAYLDIDSNISHSEIGNFDWETKRSSSNTSSFNQNVQEHSKTSEDDSEIQNRSQLNSSIVNTILAESLPKFTSSPKIESKANTSSKKRRSLDFKERRDNSNSSSIMQEHSLKSSDNFLESKETSRSNNISTASTANLSATKKLYNNQNSFMHEDRNESINNLGEDTLTASETSTIGSMLSNDEKTSEKLLDTSALRSDKNESVNLATINKDNYSNSYTTETLARDQELVVSDVNSTQSVKCDEKIQQSAVEFVERVAEPKFESNSSYDLRSAENVNCTETSCNVAKDNNLERSVSLESSFHIENVKDVQSASVLKSEKYENAIETLESIDLKPSSPETEETPPNSWSPEVMDSGYPNTASAMTPEYDLSSIAQDHISDSEPASMAEAARIEVLEVNEVENGDLANNNRDGEGNNMMAGGVNDMEDLQPLIDIIENGLENDLENENDIYVLENGFPVWLLRILNMANPIDVEVHVADQGQPRFPNEAAGDNAELVNVERDEGFDSSSEENSDLENNVIKDDGENNVNENALMDNIGNENVASSDANCR